MHDYDVQTTLNDLSRTFEEFKSTQEERLASLEHKGAVDVIGEEKMARLETSLDQLETRLRQLTAREARPQWANANAETSAHTQAFLGYARKGIEGPLQSYESKALSATTEQDGGYLVPSGLQDRLYETLKSASILRSLASVRSISTSALELLIDKEEADIGWVTEIEERPETKTPELAKLTIPVHEMYAKPRATQRLLDDAMINVEEWLAEKISQKMGAMENLAFILGNGENKPKGILTYETVRKTDWEWGKWEEITTGAKGGFLEGVAAHSFQDLFFALKPAYLPGSTWLMSRSAQAAIRRLKDDEGRYLWEPPLAGVPHPTLLGYPVVVCDDMPPLLAGTASKSVIFGNFKEAYQIVDRTDTRILRDPYSAKPYVEFYTTRRVGGAGLNFEALKVLNLTD